MGKTLSQCAENNKYLGAKYGGVGILHTWGQSLVYHPHIHMIVPAGGLSEDDVEWIASNKKFFLPVKILSVVFRGILCRLLEKSLTKGTLKLPNNGTEFKQIKDLCYQKPWVVYSEKPFATSENLINYLGNYTHRVAISNHRIIAHKDGKVSFYYKDYKASGIRKIMTLDQKEFIRRFLQHILPCGFSKIRYFGFMSLRYLQSNLDLCNTLLEKATFLPQFEGLSSYEVYRNIAKKDPNGCPKCKKGRLFALEKELLVPC